MKHYKLFEIIFITIMHTKDLSLIDLICHSNIDFSRDVQKF